MSIRRTNAVRLTHVPSGAEVTLTGYGPASQIPEMKTRANALLRAKVFAPKLPSKTFEYVLPDDMPWPNDLSLFKKETP